MEEILRSREKCYFCKDIVYAILPPKIVVRGLGVSCAGGVGGDCVFCMEDSCVVYLRLMCPHRFHLGRSVWVS